VRQCAFQAGLFETNIVIIIEVIDADDLVAAFQ
jgi:hypothetical protein